MTSLIFEEGTMRKDITKWLTVGLAALGVLTQLGVVPPAALDVLRSVGVALQAA